MQHKTRSLLEELESLASSRDQSSIIENRANNIISSAINLLDMIGRTYPPEQAELLERKLLGAIKSRKQARFAQSLRKNNETK